MMDDALRKIAAAHRLLLACDFDGTLSLIVNDPAAAVPLPGAVELLEHLARLPRTHVAVISGRALADLAERLQRPQAVRLIGSHGAEWDGDGGGERSPAGGVELSGQAMALKDQIRAALRQIASLHTGLGIEEKPASIAFHYRNAPDDVAQRALQGVLDGPAKLPGVHLKHGKKVIELALTPANKGAALQRLRRQLGDPAVLFIGDDATDEDVFQTLREGDVGVKVGAGATAARHRVSDPSAVMKTLDRIANLRRSGSA